MTLKAFVSNFRLFGLPQGDRTRDKIISFASYQPGWNDGEGDAFKKPEIDRAIGIHGTMEQLGFASTDAFPGLKWRDRRYGIQGGGLLYTIRSGESWSCIDLDQRPRGYNSPTLSRC